MRNTNRFDALAGAKPCRCIRKTPCTWRGIVTVNANRFTGLSARGEVDYVHVVHGRRHGSGFSGCVPHPPPNVRVPVPYPHTAMRRRPLRPPKRMVDCMPSLNQIAGWCAWATSRRGRREWWITLRGRTSIGRQHHRPSRRRAAQRLTVTRGRTPGQAAHHRRGLPPPPGDGPEPGVTDRFHRRSIRSRIGLFAMRGSPPVSPLRPFNYIAAIWAKNGIMANPRSEAAPLRPKRRKCRNPCRWIHDHAIPCRPGHGLIRTKPHANGTTGTAVFVDIAIKPPTVTLDESGCSRPGPRRPGPGRWSQPAFVS
jgi:hypothetical protein